MGTLFALLLIFGGFNMAAVIVKSFMRGVQQGRARAAAQAEQERRDID